MVVVVVVGGYGALSGGRHGEVQSRGLRTGRAQHGSAQSGQR